PRRLCQVLVPRIHARHQPRLVDLHPPCLDLRQRVHRLHIVRPRHVRDHRREVQLQLDRVPRFRIRRQLASLPPPPLHCRPIQPCVAHAAAPSQTPPRAQADNRAPPLRPASPRPAHPTRSPCSRSTSADPC